MSWPPPKKKPSRKQYSENIEFPEETEAVTTKSGAVLSTTPAKKRNRDSKATETPKSTLSATKVESTVTPGFKTYAITDNTVAQKLLS